MTKEEFLSLAESHYEEVGTLTDAPTLYDYEKSLYDLMCKLSREIMEKQLNEGAVTKDRRKKKR